MSTIDIGLGKTARAGYSLDEVSIVPSRRTRGEDVLDITWQIDAYKFDTPIAVQNSTSHFLDGLNIVTVDDRSEPDFSQLGDRIAEISENGGVSALAVRPQRAEQYLDNIVTANPDMLMISGRVVSAEHVSKSNGALNLKTLVRRLELPVIVGRCSSYRAALHLMRTGAMGIVVGSSPESLGVGVPLATAIADARAARSTHLDETGVYCQIIAAHNFHDGGEIAKAIVCGADAVRIDATDCTKNAVNRMVGEFVRTMATCGYENVKSFQNADLVTVRS